MRYLEFNDRPRGPMDKASAYGAGDCRFESYQGHHPAEGRGASQTEELSHLALPAAAATVVHTACCRIAGLVHKPGCMWETAVPKDDQHTSHGLVGRRRAVDLAVPGSSPGGCISAGAATACGRRGIQIWQPVDWRASSVRSRLLEIDALSGFQS